ncbi:hypothetical protein Nepgr_027361 [Nepenthes gracilis]|uniref:MSP domain-containing protein n=1 Tax=Nepenthes gracilis TaxID=150966 RepID=A0AAD3T8R3_NEPGR|nr:hypothetical protein Nepgr_027361 [Nepenthes gracilis]
MASAGNHRRSHSEFRFCGLCLFLQSEHDSSSSFSSQHLQNHTNLVRENGEHRHRRIADVSNAKASSALSSVARSLLPSRRRLRLDPRNHLYFPYEPGKQVRSAIRIKNTSKSHVAFKFQTTAPKSCYMCPPGGILAPGESLIATVFKFVEQPENNEKLFDLKTKVKFKIMSLKVKEQTEYVPELFDEQKDHVTMEQILRAVFFDAGQPSKAMEKLNRHLAEAEADVEARKRPPASADNGPKVVGEGLVIDEWKERREKYLARQQVEELNAT